MPLFNQLYGSVPNAASSTAAAAGTSGLASRGDHAHPVYNHTPTNHGLIAWTYDPALAVNTAILPTAGTIQGSRIVLPQSTSITNIHVQVTTAGTNLTNSFAALYTSGNVLVGQTANQSTNWQSTGNFAMALGSGPFTVAAGLLYVVMWANNSAGTQPTFCRCSGNTVVNTNLSAANSRFFSADTSITTTAPNNLVTPVADNGHGYWFGLS